MSWRVVPNDDTGLWEIHDECGFVCAVESESTAHTIAAAPQMREALAALLGIVAEDESFALPEEHTILDAARAALAAAKGGA